MRTYITPVKLNKFSANIPDRCIRCKDSKGTLLHYIWDCEKVKSFWKEVVSMINKILTKKLPLDPKFCLLGHYSKTPTLKQKEITLIDMCILQAKRIIV